MKKTVGLMCVLMLAALSVYGGASGVTNAVRKDSQPGFGDNSLQSKVVLFNDAVVSKLDNAYGAISVSGTTLTGLGNVNVRGAVLYDASAAATYPQFYGAPLASLPGAYSVFMEDFYEGGYTDGVLATNVAGPNPGSKFSESADRGAWLVSNTDTDSDNAEIFVIADSAQFGVLDICNNNNAADKTTVQMNGTPFKLTSGKKFWFETAFSIEDVDTNSCYIGLATADTDVIGSLPNDNIGFYVSKVAAVKGKVQIVAEAGNTNTAYTTAVTLNDYSSGTNLTTAGFYYDGVSTVRTYFKANNSGSVAVSTSVVHSATVKLPIGVFMAPVISYANGNTDTDHLYVDYIKIIQER